MAHLPSWMLDPEPPAAGETSEMRVSAKRALSDCVVELELRPAGGGDVPYWGPGAHVDLHLPGGMIRQYSLCGDPGDPGSLRVAVLREPNGRGGSRHLHDVTTIGDRIPVGAPRNNFPLEPSPRYLFVAGGIGITPLIPMIASAREGGAAWSLLYGGRSRSSMAFLDVLGEDREVTVAPEDEVGLLDLNAVLADAPAETLIYSCGPEPLLKAVERASAHWPPGSLHVERFKARDDLPVGPGTAFEVVLARSGLSLEVRPGQTILEVVAAAGISVPSSCQEGTCGTCETGVIEGEPEHRDSLLTSVDRAANECMMICCSRARSRRLVLDL